MNSKQFIILGAILFGIALGCIWAWMSFNPTPKPFFPLKSSLNFFTSAEAQGVSTPPQVALVCAFTTTPTTVTSTNYVLVQCDSHGYLLTKAAP